MSFGLSLLSMGMQMYGQVQQGRQQKQIFEYNAAVNEQKAQLARQAGDLRVDRMRRYNKSFTAKQTAAYTAAGVTLQGSPLQVLSDTAAELELDAQIEEFNTNVAVLNARNGAELDRMRGSQAASASYIGAGSTLLSRIPNFISSGNMGRVSSTPVSASTTINSGGPSWVV